MRIIKAFVALALLLGATVTALAQGQTLPPNTVLGRTGITPGPAQAIPFNILSRFLGGVSVITPDPNVTADVTINAAIAALPSQGGTVDARSYGCSSPTIANTITLGSFSMPVTLLIDRCTYFAITISNGTPAFRMANSSAVIAFGMSVEGLGGDTFGATASANISSVFQNADQNPDGDYGLKLEGFSIGAQPGAVIANGAIYWLGVHGTNVIRDVLIESVPSCGILITATTGVTTGLVQLDNDWVDSGTAAGGQPLCITAANGGGTVGINIVGGAYEHPASGNPIVNLGATTGAFVSNITFTGLYTETSFANNVVLKINGASGVTINNWSMNGVTATNCIQLTNAGGGIVSNVSAHNISGGACTHTINDVINGGNILGDINSYEYGNNSTPFVYWNGPGGAVAFASTANVTSGGITMGSSSVTPNVLYSAAGAPLPTCNSGLKGTQATVSDATAPTYRGAYASGGAVVSPVYCDGSGWKTY